MNQYTAWMVDLKGSREYALSDRSDIQNHITDVCGALNRIFAPSLLHEVAFSAGDELQGLFRSPAAAYCCARLFRMLLWPAQVRSGLGMGSWDIRMTDAGTTAQDGQAYHRARAAIARAGEQDECPALFHSDSENDVYINFAMDTAIRLCEHMTGGQNELMLLTELAYPVCVTDVMDLERLPELAEVLARRSRYGYYARGRKRNLFEAFVKPPGIVTPVYADADMPGLYIAAGKLRGMPTALSQLAGVSRQSMEKTLKTANIYSARNAAIIALRLLQKAERREK
jgi:hypothetical protein